MKNRWLSTLVAIGAAALVALPAAAQDEVQEGTLIPIGGGYTTLADFVNAALPYWQTLESDRFYILMMPMSFTYDVETLTTTDLLDNTFFADRRRWQLEEACRTVLVDSAIEEVSCRVVVPPVYNIEAANDELVADYFADDLAAVYFLGGDQTLAMQITADSALESLLTEAFERGVPMGGNSAGAAMLSRSMIAGYAEDFGDATALFDGAVLLWNADESYERGLPFGIRSALVEQHLWEYGRTPRIMNYLAVPGSPQLVLGVDGYTGAVVQDETTFGSVFGDYSAAVFDGITLGASDGATFSADGILSIHNVLVHVLAPGDFRYDIPTLTPSWAPLLTEVERDFSAISVPESAGTLQLGGSDAPALSDMVADARVLIIVTGYTEDALAEAAAAYENRGLVIALPAGDEISKWLPTDTALEDFQFITVVGGDQSLIDPAQLEPVAEAWRNGANLSLVGAAAAIAGPTYAANPPVDYDNDDGATMEAHDQGSFLVGGSTALATGLGLLDINVEPNLVLNNRFGRLFSLAFNEPAILALGLPEDTSVRIQGTEAYVSGNGAFVLDLGSADLQEGDNGAFVIANGLIDVFAPGQVIAPVE